MMRGMFVMVVRVLMLLPLVPFMQVAGRCALWHVMFEM